MAISQADQRKLFQLSGNRCAFPKCPRILVHPETALDEAVVLSEIAHIVARSLDGPRGHYPLDVSERDKYDNLVLLCEEHHHIIDSQARFYTVERLRQYKSDHERAVAEAMANLGGTTLAGPLSIVQQRLYSTVLPVLHMPRYVYGAPVEYREPQSKEVAKKILHPQDRRIMCPFLLRQGHLFCFQNLRDPANPFRDLVPDSKRTRRWPSAVWSKDPKQFPWFVSLLNRSLNKLTGRRGLNLDKDHNRYYFEPDQHAKEKRVVYKPLNRTSSERAVVWQPMNERTNTPRPFWNHLAVSLKFHRVSGSSWCLSVRPEMRVTRDGLISLESKEIGAKVTRRKSRMFNYDVLEEVQFWRDYLSESRPHIVFPFGGGQHILIDTKLMEADVTWPGIPEKWAKPFRNVEYAHDLFSAADRQQLDEEYGGADDPAAWEEFDEELEEA